MNINKSKPWTRQSGNAMVSVVLLSCALGGLALTYVQSSLKSTEASARDEAMVRARLAAHEVFQMAVLEVRFGLDPDSDGIGVVELEGDDGRWARSRIKDEGNKVYRIRVLGEHSSMRFAYESLIQVDGGGVPKPPLRGSITVQGPIDIPEKMIVDGRDWTIAGGIAGQGVPGISVSFLNNTQSELTLGAEAKVGGVGIAPANPVPANTVQVGTVWGNGMDEDGDGVVDEEAWDGLDNDGDGLIDEDVRTFPSTPDIALGLLEGSLETLARSESTYFSSAKTLEDWLANNGDQLPSQAIIYVEDTTGGVDLKIGTIANDLPSLLILHNDTGTAHANKIMGQFQGLIIVDSVVEFKELSLLGAMMVFGVPEIADTGLPSDSDLVLSPVYSGTGSTLEPIAVDNDEYDDDDDDYIAPIETTPLIQGMIRYSSEVLETLPPIDVTAIDEINPISWVRFPVTEWDDSWGDVF